MLGYQNFVGKSHSKNANRLPINLHGDHQFSENNPTHVGIFYARRREKEEVTIPKLRKTDSERSAEEYQKRMGLLGATIRIYMLQQHRTNAEAGEYLGVTGPTYKRLTDCADLMRVADLQKLAAIIPEEDKDRIRKLILP